MWFGELKVGDKFIFGYDIKYDLEDDVRPRRMLLMKTKLVKDGYYSYNAVYYTGVHAGDFIEIGKYEEIIPIE